MRMFLFVYNEVINPNIAIAKFEISRETGQILVEFDLATPRYTRSGFFFARQQRAGKIRNKLCSLRNGAKISGMSR